ncbi:MAG: alpha-2-macroglobulin [Deltaproteobacteria bacterium]|nr:alpha-2-macroglobulin [Deltaproteobacteria bacterium]
MSPRTPLRLLALLVMAVALIGGTLAIAQPDALTALIRRPAGASGTVVVPDHFLRTWDPVTLFFTSPQGSGPGAPEDHPERFVTVRPAHPGAWTWLDERTLQFRPADPWPALADYTWEAGSTSVDLITLMSPPRSTLPEDGAEGLEAVDAITLRFADALPPETLARMVNLELRPLPGVGEGDHRWLTATDFTVKALDRPSPDQDATYILELSEPIPLGTRAILHLRLSTDDRADQSFARVSFSTAEPFRAVRMGCARTSFPVAPEGVRYTGEQALGCSAGDPLVAVDFSSPPEAIGPVVGRNLVRFEPAVEHLSFALHGRRLEVRGDFDREQLYKVSLHPTALQDRSQRPLELRGASELWLYFPRQPGFLRFTEGEGVMERTGPQTVPLQGRGQARVDLRVQAIDPLDRSLWPFPSDPVAVDELARPPGPGEAPAPHTDPNRPISSGALYQQLRSLGSPQVSALVDLPLREDGGGATFGLDLEEHLDWIAGADQPGTYLVGIRPLDGSTSRAWMRVQVTDLALTTVEERGEVRFLVSSLASGRAIPGATVRLEGSWAQRDASAVWRTLWEGTTLADGTVVWKAPGATPHQRVRLQRIVVQRGDDTLVLDPSRAPDAFTSSRWTHSGGGWLAWAFSDLSPREAERYTLAHLFTERPVYRPEEEVHIKGWLRRRFQGELSVLRTRGTLQVAGPGGLRWSYPVQLTEAGGFYHRFQEDKLPTGTYQAWLEDKDGERFGHVDWQVDAYRIPRFKVSLSTPEVAPMDAPFEVQLDASYFAGGTVAARPIRWRVTPYPYAWTPPSIEGFVYSSDGRFSRTRRFDGAPRDETGRTDGQGHATLLLDPSVEASAAPRAYVIEATVTGDDDQTVTATQRVPVLPPFVLGLKAPRVLESAKALPLQIVAAGPKGELIAGQEITVRLKLRQWHSHLQASDFTSGEARYVTDVVDEPVLERVVHSAGEPLSLELPLQRAGVYLVELEARDRLGRAQVVEVDLFAAGDTPVAWSKPQAGVFEVGADAPAYNPGQTASLVLQSPWEEAEALVIVEAPKGNQYHHLKVRGGQAVFRVPVEQSWAPGIPIHTVLRRGRVKESAPDPRAADLSRPQTLANTTWIKVEPVENQVTVTLTHPTVAAPGQTVSVEIAVNTPSGAPAPAEVSLWLVDAAVLSLGKERRLDPLPDYLRENTAALTVRDTRADLFGRVPYEEMPGGDGMEEEDSPLDRATVREDFRSVPYYEPALRVGPSGRLTVQVKLPDNLTTFKVRAKAASGQDRFGFGTSQIQVRLPLLVQPSLPRFVRPGDRFVATSVGRLIEGPEGAATAAAKGDGLRFEGSDRLSTTLSLEAATLLRFPVQVEDIPYGDDGSLTRDAVSLTVALERDADKVSDAYRLRLPVQPDRAVVHKRSLASLAPKSETPLPVAEDPRPGTVRRTVLLTDQPAAVKIAAGSDYLLQYPWGCTEQRVSKARAWMALGALRDTVHLDQGQERTKAQVEQTLAWLPSVLDSSGLVAFWPGSDGSVSLTAWSLEFLVEAREAGYEVDQALFEQLTRTLRASLRSDYRQRVGQAAFYERAAALRALAQAGDFQEAYYAELARSASFQDAEAVAEVVLAGDRAGKVKGATAQKLAEGLSEQVVLRLYQGEEIYGGFQGQRVLPREVLSSEARTMATTARALARARPEDPRLAALIEALGAMGGEDGWGSTQANAAAMMALAENLQRRQGPARSGTLVQGGTQRVLTLGGDSPTAWLVQTEAPAATLRWDEGVTGFLWSELSYLPAGDGSTTPADTAGFVVSRTWELAQAGGAPTRKLPITAPGGTLAVQVGQVVEEHVQLVVPEDRYFVALQVPLAAGMEPLNPNLATAPPEARPTGSLSRAPTYASYLDDRVEFFYNHLPKGTYDFYFRTKASFEGRWIQPGAVAEDMYDRAVRGASPGATVEVTR